MAEPETVLKPYDSLAALPDAVKQLPTAAQTIWRKVFNDTFARLSRTGTGQANAESRSFSAAWSTVNGLYEEVDGQWSRRKDLAGWLDLSKDGDGWIVYMSGSEAVTDDLAPIAYAGPGIPAGAKVDDAINLLIERVAKEGETTIVGIAWDASAGWTTAKAQAWYDAWWSKRFEPGGEEPGMAKAAVTHSTTQRKADEDESWSWNAGVGTEILEVGGWEAYKRAHAWWDDTRGAIPEVRGAYKLPHHAIHDGALKTVFRGVVSAMAALLGARGGVAIPEVEKAAVYNHLRGHYGEFGREAPALKSMNPAEFATFHLEKGFSVEEIAWSLAESYPGRTMWKSWLGRQAIKRLQPGATPDTGAGDQVMKRAFVLGNWVVVETNRGLNGYRTLEFKEYDGSVNAWQNEGVNRQGQREPAAIYFRADDGWSIARAVSWVRRQGIAVKSSDDRNFARFTKIDKAEQIVWGEVYVPLEIDGQGDFMRPDEIAKMAWRYMEEKKGVGLQHEQFPEWLVPVESFIARPGDRDFIEKAWVLASRVRDPNEWAKVLSGEYVGYSIGGSGKRTPVAIASVTEAAA